MIGKVGRIFLEIKFDGESITAVMDSTSEKMYLCQVPSFGFKWLSWDRAGDLHEKGSLGVVSPSESIKDRLDVGLMIEDPLTGHMPRHG